VLPHVTDVDEAMKASAPLLHETVFTGGVDPKPTAPSNIANRSQYGHGDVEVGFKEADAVAERSFKTEQTHQGYIEPHACVASVNSDGTSELWVCTQGHFVYRQQCAALLGLDVSKLRVTSAEIGGGFGGKTHIWAEPVALALSRKAGRPVKLVMSREEVFRASGPTSATSIEVKIGARKDGTITAASATLSYSCGPYGGMWAELGAMTSFACYNLKNVKTVGYEVLVNRPKTAAYRAPSAPMAAFAVESVIGARHSLCTGADGGRRYRNPRLQRHDRRKPRHLLLVDGDHLGRSQRHRGHAGTGGQDVGYSCRRCRLGGRSRQGRGGEARQSFPVVG
jgi:CO/xanthine dehydrogenase Mo-binding subunit